MPTLHIRQVPSDLYQRLRAEAQERDVPIPVVALELMARAVQDREARSRGARAGSARMTAAERSERARKAVAAREARRSAKVVTETDTEGSGARSLDRRK